MCGIVGYFNPEKTSGNLNTLYQATSLIAHRGPDDEGYAFVNLKARKHLSLAGPDSPDVLKETLPLITSAPAFEHHLAFGFRRFSIVDMTEKGHQPFWSQDKTICLIFNGEIYNYVEIRNELEKLGHSFLTSSDTEVLLIGYRAWGMDVLKYCNGPIAMVLYDQNKNRLFFARDRVGKSPLYYAIHHGVLYWASEIKAILSMTGHSCFEINEQAVYDYLNFGWRDLDNTTFWKGIYTLKAAHWVGLDISKEPNYSDLPEKAVAYWNFPQQRLSSRQIPFSDACDQFRTLFLDAVRIRARADAKVAFSLSGGLDSSSIVSAAAHDLNSKMRCYTICFPGHPDDEEMYARQVFHRYKENIEYIRYTPDNFDFWKAANHYIWLQEEPFHYPNSELFQAYFRHAYQNGYRVMITGAGGDELLNGYPHYHIPLLVYFRDQHQYWQLIKNHFLQYDSFRNYFPRKKCRLLLDLLQKNNDKLPYTHSFFNAFNSQAGLQFLKTDAFHKILKRDGHPREYHQLTIGLMSNWLMNYWLRNSNKSHFGVPMETRSPLLDYRLVELSFSLPPEYLFNSGWTKYILRKTTETIVPREVIWCRKKRGLPFNSDVWFSQSKDIVVRSLSAARKNPFVDVNQCMNQYTTLAAQNPMLLWRLINLCLWWKKVIEKEDFLI